MGNQKIDLTVGACIVSNNKILLMLHTKLGKWLFPGGHIDQNETPDKAILREVKEETGLNFNFLQFSNLNKSPEEIEKLAIPFHANLHNVGDHDHYCIYYLGTVENEDFTRNPESKDLRWFKIGEIENLENVPTSIRRMALYSLKAVNSLDEK